MRIKDSGNRRKYESGAVRDIDEDKGRCDLLPLYLIGQLYSDNIFKEIGKYIYDGNTNHLVNVIQEFSQKCYKDTLTAILEVSIHYKEGANKYGERNWEKGIPLHCYIDSGIRHYLKWLREDNDEPHDRAFIWNMLGALWTQDHYLHLCDLPFNTIK